MDVIITEWGLQSYLDLKKQRAFTNKEYWDTIRPDVERLKGGYPSDPKFGQSSFWGPAKDLKGNVIPDAYKMKWKNLAGGNTPHLRLIVVLMNGNAYLCQAYVKNGVSIDRREMAKTKTKMNLISQRLHQERGIL